MRFVSQLLQTIAAFLLPSFLGCDSGTPPVSKEPIAGVTVPEASCTEAWIKITLDSRLSPRTIQLSRVALGPSPDSALLFTTSLVSSETLFVDTGLMPGQDYRYTLTLRSPFGTHHARVHTLDTTSHSFRWEVDTLGVSSSTLRDIAILNTSLAYAVGEVFVLDSAGQFDYARYNHAVWDGSRWEIGRATVDWRGHRIVLPLWGIAVNSPIDIWVTGDGRPVHWRGTEWTAFDLDPVFNPNVALTKMFTDPSRTYFVGRAGAIVTFDGLHWGQLQSGTSVDLNDIWCDDNATVQSRMRLVVGSNEFAAGEKKLLRIAAGDVIEDLHWPYQDRAVNSVWFTKGSGVYVCGHGVMRSLLLDSWTEQPLSPAYQTCVRGSAPNNVFVVGHFGFIAHFNGSTWHEYDLGLASCVLESVAVTETMVIAVGWAAGKGIVLRGYRQ